MQTVVNGVLTNYEVVSPKAKQTALILHGWAQSSLFWLETTKLLNSDFSYYLLDLPGFGGTKNLAENSNVPEYTEFVKEFIEKQKLKNVVLMGHSFGGQIAGDFAIKYPKIVKRLVLIDPATVKIRTLKTKAKIALAKVIKPLTRLLPPNIIKAILSLCAPPEYVNANEYLRSVLKKILKYDLSTKLHLIKVKTDIIWGSEDKVIPYMGKYLVEGIPDAKLHVVYGAGHIPNITHPQKLARIINTILSSPKLGEDTPVARRGEV